MEGLILKSLLKYNILVIVISQLAAPSLAQMSNVRHIIVYWLVIIMMMMFEPLMMFSKGFRSWIKGAVEDGDGSAGNKDLNFGWDKYLSLWGFRFFGYYEMETIFYGADFPTWQVLSPLLVAMGIQVNLFIKTLMSLRK